MTRRAAAPPLLLVAAAGSCAVLVLEALAARDISWMLVVLPVVAFLAGRASARLIGALAIALLLAGIAASQLIHYDDDSLVPTVMLPITLYLAGVALQGREALAGRLAQQTDELTAERDAYARLSVRYERARIASELHDVVAHALSVMVVQASTGQRLVVGEPGRADETFDIIATAARHAQADLDRLADLLGRDAAPDGDADLGLVAEIVDTARASGLPVTLRMSGDTSSVAGAVAHTALRVVQEGLTNALRYAPGADVEVIVEARPSSLELLVVNGRSTAPPRLGLGSGRGLTGLRERVGACGGTLDAGPNDEGGWSLRVWIAH
ncbi:MAG TPA: histidine kinase [Solirubrobacteraceae bacterium]|jgi:signal transduction histidine kinase